MLETKYLVGNHTRKKMWLDGEIGNSEGLIEMKTRSWGELPAEMKF